MRPILLPPNYVSVRGGPPPPLTRAKLAYDYLGVLCTVMLTNYGTLPFMLLAVDDSFVAWNNVLWHGHFLVGAALVFFSDAAQAAAAGDTIETFSTSVITKSKNTVTVDPSLLATSNGESGKNRAHRGGTSFGAESSAMAAYVAPGIAALISVLAGSAMFFRAS